MKFIAGYYHPKNISPPFSAEAVSRSLFHPFFSRDLKNAVYSEIKGKNSVLFGMGQKDLPMVRIYNHPEFDAVLFGQNDYLRGKDTTPGILPPLTKTISAVQKNEGEYVAVFSDKLSGNLHIINDRFSSKPFYLKRIGESLYFSTSLWAIQRMCPENLHFDPLGWMEMTTYEFTTGKRTHLAGVERLRPASHIILSRGGIGMKRYWRLQFTPGDLNPEGFSRQVMEHFKEAVVKRSAGKSGIVPLSGGLDSRITACFLPKSDYKAFTFINSLAKANTYDVTAAKMTAQRLGLTHIIRPMNAGDISRLGPMLIRLNGGLAPVHHPVKTLQNMYALTPEAPYVMGASAGDVLIGSKIPSYSFVNADKMDKMTDIFIQTRYKFSQNELKKIFKKDVVDHLYPEMEQELEASIYGIKAPTAAHRIIGWGIRERIAAFTSLSPVIALPNGWEDNPHLGYAFVDDVLKFKADWLYNRNFYKFMIQRQVPKLRDIFYANTKRILDDHLIKYKEDPYYEKKFAVKQKLRFQVRNKLPFFLCKRLDAALETQWGIFERDLTAKDNDLLEIVLETLDASSELNEMFDIKQCRKLALNVRPGGQASMADIDLYAVLATACFVVRELEEGRQTNRDCRASERR